MADTPLSVNIRGDAASAFRSHFNIDSAQQAADAASNVDTLFAAGGHPWADEPGRLSRRDVFDWAAQETKRRFDKGIYKDGELAASKPQKDGEDQAGSVRHVAHEGDWKAVCSEPDFCKVGNSVVPFDSYADINQHVKASSNVKAQGTPVYRVGDTHKGVKGDAGAHVVAGTSQGSGHVQFLTGQDNVKVNGQPVVRQGSLCKVNCNAAGVGGAMGKVVTVEKSARSEADPSKEPNAELQALLDEDNDQRSWWQKTKDAASGAWDSTERIAEASWNNPADTGVGVLKGIGNLPSDLWNLGVVGSKYATVGGIPSTAMVADSLNRAARAAYRAGDIAKANALAGRAGEMMSSGYVDDFFELKNDAQKGGSFLSMFVPVGTVAKGAGALGKAARGARALDEAADAARGLDAAADVGRGTESLADAGRATEAADAGRAAPGGEGAGIFVKPKTEIWKYSPNPEKWIKNGGKIEELPDGSVKYTNKQGTSVTYNPDGYPDFSPHAINEVKVDGLVGDTYNDFIKANEAAGLPYKGTSPPGYTWHHLQDGQTMQLVPRGIHQEFTHAGGASLLRE
ncbi:HNH endonuclease [Xanthomonas cerealis]|uniref:HNH endonuclease n=1 Tax=Xanthomonas cerealis TaxID=3390025 RepID=UPI00068BCFE8|nr:HNH endonuclease [Xanthomonas translucens]UKE46265.1 HNH endonuclease [Xanthomonas translucens pv. cerealis]